MYIYIYTNIYYTVIIYIYIYICIYIYIYMCVCVCVCLCLCVCVCVCVCVCPFSNYKHGFLKLIYLSTYGSLTSCGQVHDLQQKVNVVTTGRSHLITLCVIDYWLLKYFFFCVQWSLCYEFTMGRTKIKRITVSSVLKWTQMLIEFTIQRANLKSEICQITAVMDIIFDKTFKTLCK